MAKLGKRPRRQKAHASVGMELVGADELKEKLQAFAFEVADKIVTDAIEAGTKPILRAMIPNTPESKGSRDKQSAKTKAAWSGAVKLKSTIKAVVRKKYRYGVTNGAYGLVGPDYNSGGGHGNLFSKNHKRKVNWGRDTGTVRIVNQFAKKTADETGAATLAAVKATLKRGIDAASKKLGQ
jgi:hypothetical protein